MAMFFIGFLVGTIGVSLVDFICQLNAYILELVKSYLNVKIAKYNKEVYKINEETEIKTPMIGFHIPTEGDEDFDDEDY